MMMMLYLKDFTELDARKTPAHSSTETEDETETVLLGSVLKKSVFF